MSESAARKSGFPIGLTIATGIAFAILCGLGISGLAIHLSAVELKRPQAALWLVESLIHALIARSVISVVDAVEIVGTAADVAEEFAAEQIGMAPIITGAIDLLHAIRASLGIDLPPATPAP